MRILLQVHRCQPDHHRSPPSGGAPPPLPDGDHGDLLAVLPLLLRQVFLLSAWLVPDFLHLSQSERGRLEGRSRWRAGLRLVYLRALHCLDTLLVPRVFRDWDQRQTDNTQPEENFYQREWLQVTA